MVELNNSGKDKHLFEQHPDVRTLQGLDADDARHESWQAATMLFNEDLKSCIEVALSAIPNNSIIVIETDHKDTKLQKDSSGDYYILTSNQDHEPQKQLIHIIGTSVSGGRSIKSGEPSIIQNQYLIVKIFMNFRSAQKMVYQNFSGRQYTQKLYQKST